MFYLLILIVPIIFWGKNIYYNIPLYEESLIISKAKLTSF